MTMLQRVKDILSGLVLIIIAVVLLLSPPEVYSWIVAFTSLWLSFKGLGIIIYYFTMAQYMVGGRMTLYVGVLTFDLGVIGGTLTDVPSYYILGYMIVIFAFSGVIDVLRALESKRLGASSWKLKIGHGVFNLIMSAICIVFIMQLSVAVIVYSISLINSAVLRMISACRKTKFIYIA